MHFFRVVDLVAIAFHSKQYFVRDYVEISFMGIHHKVMKENENVYECFPPGMSMILKRPTWFAKEMYISLVNKSLKEFIFHVDNKFFIYRHDLTTRFVLMLFNVCAFISHVTF